MIWRSQFKGEGHDGYHWQMWGARGCYALRWYILYWTIVDISINWFLYNSSVYMIHGAFTPTTKWYRFERFHDSLMTIWIGIGLMITIAYDESFSDTVIVFHTIYKWRWPLLSLIRTGFSDNVIPIPRTKVSYCDCQACGSWYIWKITDISKHVLYFSLSGTRKELYCKYCKNELLNNKTLKDIALYIFLPQSCSSLMIMEETTVSCCL